MSHRTGQLEGGEQGDPLMPLLFSLTIHYALAEVEEHLLDGECLLAFKNDVYLMTKPDRIRTIHDLLSVCPMAGTQLIAHKQDPHAEPSESVPCEDGRIGAFSAES